MYIIALTRWSSYIWERTLDLLGKISVLRELSI